MKQEYFGISNFVTRNVPEVIEMTYKLIFLYSYTGVSFIYIHIYNKTYRLKVGRERKEREENKFVDYYINK